MTELPPPLPPDPLFQQPPTPPRESRLGVLLAWIVILAMVLFISVIVPLIGLRSRLHGEKAATKSTSQPAVVEAPGDDLTLRILSRYAVGAKALGASGSSELDIGKVVVPQILENAKTPIDRLKAATVVAELQGADRAVELINATLPNLAPAAREDARILLQSYRDDEPLSDSERRMLAKDLGWFGDLAAAYKQSDSDRSRADSIGLAKRTVTILATALIGVIVALVAGAALLVVALVLYFNRRLWLGFEPSRGMTGPFVESFALYLVLFMVGSIVIGLITNGESIAWSLVLTVLLPVAWIWPRLRGVPSDEIWRGLGWHRGQGVFKEIGCGLLGYITGLPVIAVGMAIVAILVMVSKSAPSHPIQNELSTQPMRVFELYLIASIWAPIFEETMFRGALFNFMRSRFRWLFSASVVALIFALIHPQGWTTVPALFAIALVLAGIREWRGTIIGSMTAHALHNGILVTILILAVA